MSRIVPHPRPEFGATSQLTSGAPVSSSDWQLMAGMANWSLGHGGHLIPACAVGQNVTTGNTGTFHFWVHPKATAVQRIWRVAMRASATGTTAAVKCGGASSVTRSPPTGRSLGGTVFEFTEELGTKTSTPEDAIVTVTAAGGTVTVVSIEMYEQTRKVLATADSGVDITSMRPRTPIADLTNENIAGVFDAYNAMDARRPGFFHWPTEPTSAIAITAGVGSPASLFDLNPPAVGALFDYGGSTSTVRVSVYAKVDAGTGTVTFASTQAGDSVTCSVTATSFAWSHNDLIIEAEDPAVADGRRGSVWEDAVMTAYVTAANTLSIAAISIGRLASNNPI